MLEVNHATASRRAWAAFTWIGMCAFFLQAVWYVSRACDPMPQADNWANLDYFLRKAYYQGLGLSDFLWNRGSGDHSQPLDKVLLWVNARYFGLDFMLEGLFAMLLGFGAMLLLRRAAMAEGKDIRWGGIGAVAIAAIFFSLNSTRIYAYSMITMWFSLYLGMFASVLLAWKVLNGGNPAWLVVTTFVVGVIADDVGYLAAASITLALCLCGGRGFTWRRTALVIACCLGGFLLSALFYVCFRTNTGAWAMFHASPGRFVNFLRSDYGQFWKWWVIPSASGLVYFGTMRQLFGEQAAQWIATGMGILLLPLHAWFWWKAWTRRPDLAGFMAVCVMLFYYAHLAGIVYGRLPILGTDFLWAPRYISFYQLGVIALLLMLVAAANDAVSRGERTPWRYAMPAVLVILLQLPIGWNALAHSNRPMRLMEKKASALAAGAIGTPEATRKCMEVKELRRICSSDYRRKRFLDLLVDNRLSIFSPEFQHRHPRLAAAAAEAVRPDSTR